MKQLALLTILCIGISSCSTYNKSAIATTPQPIISLPPVDAELIVDKSKVLSGFSETTTTFGIFKSGDNKFADAITSGGIGNREKQAAIYKALDGTGFDILINPKYIVEIKKGLFQTTISAKVVGYGAKIDLK